MPETKEMPRYLKGWPPEVVALLHDWDHSVKTTLVRAVVVGSICTAVLTATVVWIALAVGALREDVREAIHEWQAERILRRVDHDDNLRPGDRGEQDWIGTDGNREGR